jgi:hypothetical protein
MRGIIRETRKKNGVLSAKRLYRPELLTERHTDLRCRAVHVHKAYIHTFARQDFAEPDQRFLA